jgi:hypothetical protein
VISDGLIRVRSIAWAKNRRAASVSRRSERKMSMTLAELIGRTEQVAPGAADLQIGLIDVPAIPHGVSADPIRLGELRARTDGPNGTP